MTISDRGLGRLAPALEEPCGRHPRVGQEPAESHLARPFPCRELTQADALARDHALE